MTARPMGSAFLTTIGAGGALMDAGEALTSAALNPIAFTISAAVGAVLATLAYSCMNQSPDFLDEWGDERRIPKFFFLSTASLLLGILPTLISKIISVTARFFCGSIVGGFRAGFLGMQAVLQGVETYPLLDFRARPADAALMTPRQGSAQQTSATPARMPGQNPQSNLSIFYQALALAGTPGRRRSQNV